MKFKLNIAENQQIDETSVSKIFDKIDKDFENF